jgi:PST family polysaccharide transporter
MTLIKTSLLNGFATIVRIGALIGLNKVIAIYVGPAGYALIGQFSNIASIAVSISGGSIVATGVTKYTADYFNNETKQQAIWRSASLFIVFTSLPLSILIFFFSKELSTYFFKSSQFDLPLIFLAISLPMMALNSLLLSILNGKKEFRSFILQNISASIVGALISGALAIRFGLMGALVALSLNQSLMLFITLWICRDATWLTLKNFIGPTDIKEIKLLLGYGLMSIVSALLAPLGQYIVRNQLIEEFGAVAAGEWQAVFKISEIYLMFFTATLSIYYLPRLSEIRKKNELKNEIRKVYLFILPLTILSAIVIYQMRELITLTLFSKDFIGMTKLFSWQLLGDVLKIGSWILSFVMVGKGMVRWFLFTEIFFVVTWIGLTVVLTGYMGLLGAPAAFALNYGLYWFFMFFLIKNKFK